MIMPVDDKLVRIAIFYDGGYFNAVSDYYKFGHSRRARLSFDGLNRFVRREIAEREKVDESYCQIVEAHYFRGRFSADAAEQAGKLKEAHAFDDVLIRAGIVQHYLPMAEFGKVPQEKGIDVWLSLEAFDLAVHKRFNVLALVGCDGDYVSLVRKLNSIGTRVMLLGWDFEYQDQSGRKRSTRTAHALISNTTYPIMMHTLIDDRTRQSDPLINGLFLS